MTQHRLQLIDTREHLPHAQDPFYMAGSEGTGEYVTVAVSQMGRVGFRCLGGNSVCVRIEPRGRETIARLSRLFSAETGWWQPDSSHNRFSKRFESRVMAANAVHNALAALSVDGRPVPERRPGLHAVGKHFQRRMGRSNPRNSGLVYNPEATNWLPILLVW